MNTFDRDATTTTNTDDHRVTSNPEQRGALPGAVRRRARNRGLQEPSRIRVAHLLSIRDHQQQLLPATLEASNDDDDEAKAWKNVSTSTFDLVVVVVVVVFAASTSPTTTTARARPLLPRGAPGRDREVLLRRVVRLRERGEKQRRLKKRPSHFFGSRRRRRRRRQARGAPRPRDGRQRLPPSPAAPLDPVLGCQRRLLRLSGRLGRAGDGRVRCPARGAVRVPSWEERRERRKGKGRRQWRGLRRQQRVQQRRQRRARRC